MTEYSVGDIIVGFKTTYVIVKIIRASNKGNIFVLQDTQTLDTIHSYELEIRAWGKHLANKS